MRVFQNLLTVRQAAVMIGVSYPTIKQWILRGQIKSIITPGGHHRIALASLKPHLETLSRGEGRVMSESQKGAKRDPQVVVLTVIEVNQVAKLQPQSEWT